MSRSNLFQQLFGRKDPVFRSIERAIEHLEEQAYDEAIKELQEKALTLQPENKRALLHLGITHMLKGELDAAESLIRPIAADPDRMNSEKAAAQIAMERIEALRREQAAQA